MLFTFVQAESFFLVIIFTVLLAVLWIISKYKEEEPEPVRSTCVTGHESANTSRYQFISVII